MKTLITCITLTILFIASAAYAQQLDISAEVRPRYERRQGFKKLFAEGDDPASFVSQRTRLIAGYKSERINMKVSLQNIRTWGDVATMAKDDRAVAFHEAWAEAVFLSGKLLLQVGRQEIIYDDHRIFGNVGWAQQARSHDALRVKFIPNEKHRVDAGFALNATGETLLRQAYSIASYKTFQYVWYHGQFNRFGVSALLLNTGTERPSQSTTIDYMQTIGTRLTYKKDKFSTNASVYLQTGRYHDKPVSALDFAVNASYNVWNGLSIGFGYEHLSGKNSNDRGDEITSFKPLFGTNHKFNGLMDYFYVGNHNESVGLNDISIKLAYKKGKFSVQAVPHIFLTAADLYSTIYFSTEKQNSNLGTELDIVAGYNIFNSLSVKLGFSSMFATESMEVLKGGNKDLANNWTWAMITFKPTLFSWNKNNKNRR